jgi:hypothetical protein
VVNNADLGPGDRVHIGPGVYRETVNIRTEDSGGPGNPVTFIGGGGTVVEGLDPRHLDDATAVLCTAGVGCGGDGIAYPMVYRFGVAGRTIAGLVETNWTPIRVDDSLVTGVVFDLMKPIPAKRVSSLSDVQKISGSFMVAGDALFVHPFQDIAPSVTANDLEIIRFPTVFDLRGAAYVRLQNLTVRYASQQVVLISGSDDIELRDLTIHSAPGVGVLITNGSARTVVRNVDVSHVWGRKEFTRSNRDGSCYSAECGWHNDGGGTGFKIDGGSGGASGFDVRGLTAYNAWNVVSIEQVKNSTFVDVLAKNSPNHTFIMMDNLGNPNCRDNLLEGILAFNGQDSVYLAGCQGGRVVRSAFNHWLQGKTSVNSPSTGWRLRGVLGSRGIALASDSRPGFDTDYNFMAGEGPYCKIAFPDPTGTVKYACDGDTWKGFGYDNHSRHTGVRLSGFSAWPPQNGLEMSRKTRADFYPVTGSSTIDAGDPDLDGDGTLETGPGADDECIAAHNCAGAGPDIGPFEYGLVVATGDDEAANPPTAPTNVRRTDSK